MDYPNNDETQSSSLPDAVVVNPSAIDSTDEWTGKRRRRSRQFGRVRGKDGEGNGLGNRHMGNGRAGRKLRRGRMTSRDKAKRLMIMACGLLSLCLATLVGFMVGKKSSDSSASPDQSVSLEVVQPTSASEALLDDAFRALRDGQPKKALLTFQKIQQSQPSLTGIDYLIGHAAHSAGESSIAEEAFQRSLAKKEMDEEARLALAMNHLFQGSAGAQRGSQLSDPLIDAECEFRRFSALHPMDSNVYLQWAEALRSRGSYRSAAETMHKGVLRSDLSSSQSLLSAKEALTRLQNNPSKVVPSLSGITSMSGEIALASALESLQMQQQSEALLFLERAREFYTPTVFAELMKDNAFDPYRTDSKMRSVFSKDWLDQSSRIR